MLFRRKWISNFIWILAMIVLIVMGAQYAFLYGIDFLFSQENSYLAQVTSVSYVALDVGLIIWIIIYMGACIGVFLIGRALTRYAIRRYSTKPHIGNIIKILLVAGTFLIAIIYRGYLLISSDAVLLKDSTWFDAAAMALSGEGDISSLTVHGASFAYISILKFVMQFLGDRIVAVVLLQIVIQILTIFLVYSTFSCLVNFPCGLSAAFILAISPIYTSGLYTSNPGCFVALLVIAGMYLVTCVYKSDGKAKIWIGLILGVVCGYTIYLDLSVILFIIPWLFCLLHEAGNKEKKGYLIPYLLMLAGAVLGVALSLCMDGGFVPDNISIAAQTLGKVISSTKVPEYSIMDTALGATGLIWCMVLIGFASFTVMGMIGRDKMEYELPWVLMFLCAITPMTRIGYLHDGTTAHIIYLMLSGAGISALKNTNHLRYLVVKHDADGNSFVVDENGNPVALDENGKPVFADNSDAEIPGDEVESTYRGSDDGVDIADGITPVEDIEIAELDEDTESGTILNDTIETEYPELVPVAENQDKADLSSDKENEDEELPTSISWASIKALDDDLPDILHDEDEGSTVLSSAGRDYDVVIDGATFVTEEVYNPEGDDDESEAEPDSEPVLESVEASEPELESEPDIKSDITQSGPLQANTDAFAADSIVEFESLDDIDFTPAATAEKQPETMAEPETIAEPEAVTEPEAEPQTEAESEPEPEVVEEPESKSEPEPEVIAEPESKSEPEPEAESEPKPENKPKPLIQPERLKQVDELPGMIPNPLPLPARRAHTGMSYDYDDFDDDDDYDYDYDKSSRSGNKKYVRKPDSSGIDDYDDDYGADFKDDYDSSDKWDDYADESDTDDDFDV